MSNPPANRKSAEDVVADAVRRWQSGAAPDALEVLQQHPELRRFKSLEIDLAYEEYCLRTERGEEVPVEDFCAKFAGRHKSVQLQIECHQYLEKAAQDRESAEDFDWPVEGEDFFGFEIAEELGRGAFGRVYLAREVAVGEREVAIKVSPSGHHEAGLLGKLEHPNVVRIHSVIPIDETAYSIVCMPYCGRATLCDLIDAGRFAADRGRPLQRAADILDAVRSAGEDSDADELALPPATPEAVKAPNAVKAANEEPHPELQRGSYVDGLLWLMQQAAEALDTVHQRGVIHLDLKPSNILLTAASGPLLLDFNLSQQSASDWTRVGGTLPYMSPEQIRVCYHGEGSVDHRSDLYSLGVIFYELLSGRLPYDIKPGDNSPQAADDWLRQQSAEQYDLGPLHPEADRRVKGIVRRCLRPAPEDRFASAAELAEELRRARLPSSRLLRSFRARPVANSLPLVALFSVIVAAGLWWRSLPTAEARAGEMRRVAQQAFARANFGEAMRCFDLVLQANPNDVSGALGRARCLVRMGRFRDAERDLRWLDKTQRMTPAAQRLLGYVLACQRDFKDAAFWLENATDAASQINYARCVQLRRQDYRAARSRLRSALRQGKHLLIAHHNLAMVEFAWAQLEQRDAANRDEHLTRAMEAIEHALKQPDPPGEVWVHAGQIYFWAARFDRQRRSRGLACFKQAAQYYESLAGAGLRPSTLRQLQAAGIRASGRVTRTPQKCARLVEPDCVPSRRIQTPPHGNLGSATKRPTSRRTARS